MNKTARPEKTDDGFSIIYDKRDIPAFTSEAEEADYWATHTYSEELLSGFQSEPRAPGLPTPRSRGKKGTRSTSLRLEQNVTERLRVLAERKGTAYQTLLKQFVLERLYEEEKREGIINPATESG